LYIDLSSDVLINWAAASRHLCFHPCSIFLYSAYIDWHRELFLIHMQ